MSAMLAYVTFRGLFSKAETAGGASSLSSDTAVTELQTSLKKLIDQTASLEKNMAAGVVVKGAVDSAPAGSAPAADPVEIENLKKALAEKDEELKKSKDDSAGEKLKAQSAKLEELQSKLAEYEILEDDIADLSLYKEENARLKAELDGLKAKGGASSPETIMTEFADAAAKVTEPAAPTEPQKPAEAPDATDPSEPAPFPTPDQVSADLAEDVAAALAASLESTLKASEPAPPPEVAVPSAPVAEPTPAAPQEVASAAPPAAVPAEKVSENPTTDDVFAEFSGNLDTDRVMEDLAALDAIPADGDKASLDETDPEKLVAQAAGFGNS